MFINVGSFFSREILCGYWLGVEYVNGVTVKLDKQAAAVCLPVFFVLQLYVPPGKWKGFNFKDHDLTL